VDGEAVGVSNLGNFWHRGGKNTSFSSKFFRVDEWRRKPKKNCLDRKCKIVSSTLPGHEKKKNKFHHRMLDSLYFSRSFNYIFCRIAKNYLSSRFLSFFRRHLQKQGRSAIQEGQEGAQNKKACRRLGFKIVMNANHSIFTTV